MQSERSPARRKGSSGATTRDGKLKRELGIKVLAFFAVVAGPTAEAVAAVGGGNGCSSNNKYNSSGYI